MKKESIGTLKGPGKVSNEIKQKTSNVSVPTSKLDGAVVSLSQIGFVFLVHSTHFVSTRQTKIHEPDLYKRTE